MSTVVCWFQRTLKREQTDRQTHTTTTVTLAHARRGLTTVTLAHARRGLTSLPTTTYHPVTLSEFQVATTDAQGYFQLPLPSTSNLISSGWFQHIEPHRTPLINIISEREMCVQFCHISSGWFKHIEPHRTLLNNMI